MSSPGPRRLSRLLNSTQTLLILAGLALVLALPGYLLAGSGGILVSLAMAALTAYLSRWMPARLILANAGAGLLHRHQAPRLYRVLDELYRRAGLQMAPQLYYAHSPALNAFAVGDRHDGAIAVTDGLLNALSLRQLAGVLAHEVTHLQHGDTRVMSMAAAMTRLTVWLATIAQLTLLLMLPLILSGEVRLPWLLLLGVAISPSASTLLQLALSRNREYQADLEAVTITGDPEALASALTVIERQQGAWLSSLFGRQPPTWMGWLSSHPSPEERIRRVMAAECPRRVPSVPHQATEHSLLLERPHPRRKHHWLLPRRRGR
ncbi:zinc metalloprotease HtpX [Halomonas sp. YLGW01]|uniref:zinc metalloprotease HtpX n=1 Tax=Halomonas sp. YLGW01 TaxID=2773308 RepID=UPI0017809BA9|nr:zinc metalloprotease HtpX [Halomonas sp. YLGW01]